MKIRIEIKTPNGMAEGVIHGRGIKLNLLRRMLGINLKHDSVKVNDENNMIIWKIDSDVRSCMKIIRNVQMYDVIVSSVFTNKTLKKAVKKHMLPEQQEELRAMLEDMTDIKVVRE